MLHGFNGRVSDCVLRRSLLSYAMDFSNYNTVAYGVTNTSTVFIRDTISTTQSATTAVR